MRWFVFIILGWCCTVLQTMLFVPRLLAFRPFHADLRPDLFVLMALLAALVARGEEAFIAGWVIGMVADLTDPASQRLGAMALMLALCSYAVCRIRPVLAYERPAAQILLAVAMVLVVRPVQLLIVSWHSSAASVGFGLLVEQTLGDALYTAVLAWPFLWVTARLATHRGRLSERS
jgi:rod shape-determining protein MreD